MTPLKSPPIPRPGRGKRYNGEKQAHGAPEGNQRASKQTYQNDKSKQTHERLAEEYKVSPATSPAPRPQVSDRQIAKGLGVSDKTVGTVRKDLESIAEIPQCDRQTKDGRTYPAQRQPVKPTPEPARPVSLFSAAASEKEAADLGKKAAAVIEKAARPLCVTLGDDPLSYGLRSQRSQTRGAMPQPVPRSTPAAHRCQHHGSRGVAGMAW